MKGFGKFAVLSIVLFGAIPTYAEDVNLIADTNNTQDSNSSEQLQKYLKNLGAYLGYDVKKSPEDNAAKITADLLDFSAGQLAQSSLYKAFLGAIPVNAHEGTKNFVPSGTEGIANINDFANKTFADFGKAEAGAGSSLTPIENIDQLEFQPDPTNQTVLNILAAPDYSNCLTADGNVDPNCTLLYQNKVLSNVIGTLPVYTDPKKSFFSYDYNKTILNQLNSNSLLGPLLYNSENAGASNDNNSANPGLTAKNQLQDAGNFIRYASATVVPPQLPKYDDYVNVYLSAYTQLPDTATAADHIAQLQSKATLNNYFASLRIYAAQSSAVVSNLYYLMSKRMPQNLGGNEKGTTSQALSEFKMATWRLKPADTSDATAKDTTWLAKINTASAATVQKEIAILLAEINYQLYLNRQQEERNLLANTLILAQNTKNGQPTAFTAPNTSVEQNSPGTAIPTTGE